ncbi:MAG: biopolymer transporter ExbD [Synergistaceae bacterium]|nr:biopolymer transporter ExbD [Synergistaceae bacterium]
MRKRRASPDVDITPLMDVMFMLIIFFIVTTSFSRGEISVTLPGGQGDKMEGEITVLNVEANGRLLIDGKEVRSSDLAGIAIISEQSGRKFVIAGDKTAPYGVIANILELLRIEGVSTATLAIEGY